MKYEHKKNQIKSNKGRKWFKRTLKRSERAIAQEEVKNQVNEVIDTQGGVIATSGLHFIY